MDYPEKRELDGAYFRVERNGKWESVCFTDLTSDERDEVCEGRTAEWLKSMVDVLADKVREIGDQFDIVCRYEWDEA